MNISKKIMSIFALFLIMFSAVLPMANLNAKDINFTTQDFYLADEMGNKIDKLNIDDESFKVQVIHQNAEDKKLDLQLPDGIQLDQEETGQINENSETEITYNIEAKSVVLSYNNIDMNTHKTVTTLQLTKDGPLSDDSKILIKSIRDNETVYSEPLYLIEDQKGEEKSGADEVKEEEKSEKTDIVEEEKIRSVSDSNVVVNIYAFSGMENPITDVDTGDVVDFFITVSNRATFSSANDVLLENTLPESFDYEQGSTMINGKMQDDADIWEGNTLSFTQDKIGPLVPMQIRYRAHANGKQLGNVDNTAVRTYKGKTKSSTVSLNVHSSVSNSDVVIGKKALDREGSLITSVNAGETYVYQISITNYGAKDAYNIEVEDTLPIGTDYIPNSTTIDGARGDDYDVWSGRTFDTSLYKVNKGSTLNIKFEVKANGRETGNISNTAYRTYAEGKRSSTATIEVKELNVGNVVINKKATDGNGSQISEIVANNSYYYELVVANNGQDSFENVEVKDNLPKGVNYMSNSTTINGQLVDDINVWSENALDTTISIGSRESTTIRFKVMANGDVIGNVDNIATRTIPLSNEDDVVESNRVTVEIKKEEIEENEVTIYKRALNTSGQNIVEAEQGDTFTYQIILNNGDVKGTDISVTDKLPTGVEYIPGTTTINGNEQNDNSVWIANKIFFIEFENLNANAIKLIKFDVRVTGDKLGTITNKVDASNSMGEDATSSVSVNIKEPSMKILVDEKALDPKKGEEIDYTIIGDEIMFEMSVQNVSNGISIQDLHITDELEPNLEYVQGTTTINNIPISDKDVWSGSKLEYETDLKNDEVVVIHFNVTVIGQNVHGTVYNEVDVTKDDISLGSAIAELIVFGV